MRISKLRIPHPELLGQSISGTPFLEGKTLRPGKGLLFVATQGLGDLVQTFPLIRAIYAGVKGRWPVYLLLASPRHYEPFREERLPVRPIFVRESPGAPHSYRKLWRKLAGEIDVIVSAPEISAAKLFLLSHAIRARHVFAEASPPISRWFTSSPRLTWSAPWSSVLDEIAASLGISAPLPPPQLHLSAREIEWANSTLAQAGVRRSEFLLGLHCSSAIPQKRWPPEDFGEFARLLSNRLPGMHVVSFGAHDELADAHKARHYAGEIPWLEGAGRWNLRETMAMLSRCSLLVSGDTGLMHIAAALGVRTLTVFGPTSTSRRAPNHNGGIAVCPQTSCHPCFRGKWTPCQCIRSISPVTVFAAALRLMNASHNAEQPYVCRTADIFEPLTR